jgi:predicted metallo-beta-lactamase superfamily hydrolase
MKIIPLAADSLGVRSMATYVEVGSTGILIDPGATLAPTRFNLPPSAAEVEALRRANDRIAAYATRAAFVFVSHYHEDHFGSDPSIYARRRVLLKDPRRMVSGLQAQRASALWRMIAAGGHAEAADGTDHREMELTLRVSPPLPHGVEGTSLGYLVALTVVDPAERERFVFASDVQGPMSPVAGAWLSQERPTVMYLSGPPSYVEREIGRTAIEQGIDNLLRVMERTACRVIMDHYAVRDLSYEGRFRRLWDTGRVLTAARWLGLDDAALERRRRELWAEARKPPASAPTTRATMTWTLRKSAKGGRSL